MKLIITGDVPSKKNSKRIVYVRGKMLILPSVAYKNWHSEALAQLWGKRSVQAQIGAIELIFYPSTKRKADLSNKTESIMDLLVDAGIIKDDNWYEVPELHLRFGAVDKESPRVEITIQSISSSKVAV